LFVKLLENFIGQKGNGKIAKPASDAF